MTFTPAVRSLRRTPTVTLAAILTLALAIGVNTAMFSIVYGVLLRPLPFADPGSLVQIAAVDEAAARPVNFSAPELADWEERARAFSSVAMFAVSPFTITGDGDAEAVRGAVVSAHFFDTLGVAALRGRPLGPADDRAPVAVVSERLWRRRFGARPGAVGAAMTLDGRTYTVAGVMPAAFRFPADDVDAWTPMGYAATVAPPQWKMRGYRPFSMVARLKPGVSLREGRQDAATIAGWLARTYPRFSDRIAAGVDPLSRRLTERVRPALLMLFGAAGLVLLIACANLASLAVVRTAGRTREIAIRTALGAGRHQLLAQFLTESGLVAAAGGAIGLIVAGWVLGLVARVAPAELPRLADIRIDAPVLLFAFGVTTLVTVMCGTMPAMIAARAQPVEGLRDGRAVSGAPTRRLQRGLVAVEIGLSVVLLVGASLLGRSLAALVRADSGVRQTSVLTLKVNLAGSAAATPVQQAALVGRLLDALTRLGGVRSAAATSSLPPNVSQMHTSLSTPARQASGQPDVAVEIVAASPDLFTTLGVPLLKGRSFSGADAVDARRVIVLSATAAQRLFPDGDPIGRRLAIGPPDPRFGDPEVVGIAGDMKYSGLDAAPDGAVYMPYAQRAFRVMYLLVNTTLAPDSLVPAVRRAIASTEPSLAVSDVRSFDAVMSDAVAQPRFRTWLLAALAALALLLAAVGLYGVIAHAVAERATEISIRMALGARRSDILRMVLREGAILIALGLALGVVGAVALTRTMAAMMYGVQAHDPMSYGAAAGFVAGVGLIASAIPAVRASHLDSLRPTPIE